MENREANQAAFEKVVRHLLKQGKRSEREDSLCMYRGPNGLRCAVGCLIADDEYDPWMERCGIDKLLMGARSRGVTIRSLGGLDPQLLWVLQTVHDQQPVLEWRDQLAGVAAAFGLTMPDLESPNV